MKKDQPNHKKIVLIETDVQDKAYLIFRYITMSDSDLAKLYGIETRILNQTVNRSLDLFPYDIVFQMTTVEWNSLISQIVISKQDRGDHGKIPYDLHLLNQKRQRNHFIYLNSEIIKYINGIFQPYQK